MKAILIHPESAEQLKTVKSILKALKVPFEAQSDALLPGHVLKSIAKGIEQADHGDTIGLDEFRQKHFLKK